MPRPERLRPYPEHESGLDLLQATLDHMDQGILVVDEQFRILLWNRRFVDLYDIDTTMLEIGREIDPIIERSAQAGNYTELTESESVHDQIRARMEVMSRQGPHILEQTTANGTIIEIRASPLPQGGLVHTYTDVTDTRIIERRLNNVLVGSQAGAWEWDVQTGANHINERWAEIIGETPHSLGGLMIHDFRSWIHPDDLCHFETALSPVLVGDMSQFACEFRMRHANGHWVWVLSRGRVTQRAADGSPSIMAGVHLDVTDRKILEERLQQEHERIKVAKQRAEYYAARDPLTGLLNRASCRDHIETRLTESQTHHPNIAVLFCDLDDFKSINDSIGHSFGDTLLKVVGERLATALRAGDMLARFGGDEFIAVLSDIDAAGAETVAGHLAHVMAEPFEINEETLFISVSIGISLFPEHGESADELIRSADIAMYAAKETGRNRCAFFNDTHQDELRERSRITQALQRSIGTDAFSLAVQPKFCIESTPKVIGYEALLRWSDSQLGKVSPEEFIPIAEATGHIRKLDRIAIEQACNLVQRWQELGNTVPIAVNLSARTLQDDGFADSFLETLADAGIATSMISIEITETAFLSRSRATSLNIGRLIEAGTDISVDDFGTGYASLGYLQDLPLSEIKIDRSFILRLHEDERGRNIVRAIIQMANALDMRIVAEGVETAEQLDWLRRNGCLIAQGFLLAHPKSPDDIAASFT